MSLTECARLVETGDRDRFAATMAAPVAVRERLWPLYAANLEIARAPWASDEPMVAEMRLQWWIDTIAELGLGQVRPGHAVTEGLVPVLRDCPAVAPLLSAIAEARRRDAWHEAFADHTALMGYLDQTAGNLFWAAALVLGAPAGAEMTVRGFGLGAGLAAYLMAVPELEARGRVPLVDGRAVAVAALAGEGIAHIDRARQNRQSVPATVAPALWPGWQARGLLTKARRDPALVGAGGLALSEFRRRGGLLRRVVTRSW